MTKQRLDGMESGRERPVLSDNPLGMGDLDISLKVASDIVDSLRIEPRASGEFYSVRWVGPETAAVMESADDGPFFKGECVKAGADCLEDRLSSDHCDNLYIARGSFERWDWPIRAACDCV